MAQPGGFERFRQHLLRRAKEAVVVRNPIYVQTLARMAQDDADLDDLLQRLGPHLRGDELREWQPLLETAEQCRACMRAARVAVRFFNTPPPDEYLGSSGVSPGDWVHYHFSSWIIEIHALLERVEQLVKRACRQLLRPRDSSWQTTQESLLASVSAMRRAAEDMRVRHAHGFGYFDAVEDEKLWEFHVVAFPDVDLVASGLAQEVQFTETWGKRILQMTASALAVIDVTFDELTTKIGWQPLPSGTSK